MNLDCSDSNKEELEHRSGGITLKTMLSDDSASKKLESLVNSKTRRGQIEILIDILTWASPRSGSKGVTKTHLAYASGLNFQRFEKYLQLLVQRGLIELIELADNCEKATVVGNPRVYRTTVGGERMRQILLEAEDLILGEESEILDSNEPAFHY
jgi:predicted transcriptional regulator